MDGSLAGKRILITRNKKQAGPFADCLKKEGAEPVIIPLLSFQKRATKENSDIISKLHDFSWLFFTSANGVKFFFDLVEESDIKNPELLTFKIASIGSKTAKALKGHNLYPDFQPSVFNGTVMAEEFLIAYPNPGTILLVEGSLARKDIKRELARQQVLFQAAVVYDTIVDEQGKQTLNEHLQKNDIDIYTFTSPSTVNAFEQLGQASEKMKKVIKKEKLCVCIGNTTKKAAEKAGFSEIVTPEESTIEGMVEVTKKYVNGKG